MDDTERAVTDPKRIKHFAVFVKNYMGVSSFVVAALPVPVRMLKLIPVYPPDAGSISVITSLTCFLILAFIFFNRHALAMKLFVPTARPVAPGRRAIVHSEWRMGRSRLPLTISLLIVSSITLFLVYLFIMLKLQKFLDSGAGGIIVSFEFHRVLLIGLYTAFFAAAEAAFILMATKEYLQELLNISEADLMGPPPPDPPGSGR